MWLPDAEIEITLPKAPFRIHPDASRSAGPLLCTHARGKWWLAHPDAVSPGQLCAAAWVHLFEGVESDGTSFLMPVFRYARDDGSDPEQFLHAAVERARKQWVRIDGVLHQDDCRIVTAEVSRPAPIQWSPHGFADLVDIGFGGRYLGSWRDVAVHLLGAREFIVHAPRPDYFTWMRKQFDPDDTQFDDERGFD